MDLRLCYHGFSETPGQASDCEVCKERDELLNALKMIEPWVGCIGDGGFITDEAQAAIEEVRRVVAARK